MSTTAGPGYEETAQTLLQRIRALAEERPEEVAACGNPFHLFKLGLNTDGLSPSLAQAQVCLGIVKRELRGEK